MLLYFKEKLTKEQLETIEKTTINIEQLDDESIEIDTWKEERYYCEHGFNIQSIVQVLLKSINVEVKDASELVYPPVGEDLECVYKIVVADNKVSAYSIVISYSNDDSLVNNK